MNSVIASVISWFELNHNCLYTLLTKTDLCIKFCVVFFLTAVQFWNESKKPETSGTLAGNHPKSLKNDFLRVSKINLKIILLNCIYVKPLALHIWPLFGDHRWVSTSQTTVYWMMCQTNGRRYRLSKFCNYLQTRIAGSYITDEVTNYLRKSAFYPTWIHDIIYSFQNFIQSG